MSLKMKFAALGALCLALSVSTACMQPKAKEAVQTACTQVARVCADGSNAVRESDTSCYQKCPEDTGTVTNTATETTTATVTATGTVTATATN